MVWNSYTCDDDSLAFATDDNRRVDQMKYYLLIVFIALMTFLLIGSYIHENSHERVFYGYGYESVTNYNMLGFLGADTVAVSDDLKHDVAGVNQMNIWAEIIGYNTILLGIGMIISAFIIGFAIMMRD